MAYVGGGRNKKKKKRGWGVASIGGVLYLVSGRVGIYFEDL